MLDASRAVGVCSSAAQPTSSATASSPTMNARATSSIRDAARARQTGPTLVSLDEARAQRVRRSTGRATRRRRRAFLGVQRARRLCRSPSSCAYIDWTPFFQTWELRRHAIPTILDDPVVGEAARKLFDDAQAMLDADRRRASWLHGERASSASSRRNARRRRHRDLRRRVAHARARRRCTSCASRPTSRRASRTSASPTSSRRRSRGVADYIGAFAVTAGHRHRELVARFEARARRLQRDPAQGARRPPGRSVRRAAAPARAARALGLRAGRGARRSGDDRGRSAASAPRPAIRPARPHREGDAVRAARRAARASPSPRASRCSRRRRSAASTSRIRTRSTSRSARSTATRSRTTPAASRTTWRRPSAGWRRCWRTTASASST